MNVKRSYLIAARASSAPCSYARRTPPFARRIPSTQIMSVKGFARRQTYGSINCVNASRPVLAVTARGKSRVSSGSTFAYRGSIDALNIAEGAGRSGPRDQARHYAIARGSGNA